MEYSRSLYTLPIQSSAQFNFKWLIGRGCWFFRVCNLNSLITDINNRYHNMILHDNSNRILSKINKLYLSFGHRLITAKHWYVYALWFAFWLNWSGKKTLINRIAILIDWIQYKSVNWWKSLQKLLSTGYFLSDSSKISNGTQWRKA